MIKIIIADDEESVRKLLSRYINGFVKDAEVDEVDDGIPLVEKVRNNNYDLVITDNSMKKMNGLESIKKIREFNAEIPIYMISADEDKKEQALNLGATEFIYKLDGAKKIIECLEKIVNQNL